MAEEKVSGCPLHRRQPADGPGSGREHHGDQREQRGTGQVCRLIAKVVCGHRYICYRVRAVRGSKPDDEAGHDTIFLEVAVVENAGLQQQRKCPVEVDI